MTYKESKMSVDWLESKIQNYLATYGSISPKMISVFAEQAKAIHKEEIIKSNEAGFDDGNGFVEEMKYKTAEHYYNETFGGGNK